ncbi:MAG: sigma-70 family RNA polymerase sigma factor [bacterium]|nr:sigma-70 family RNA polymerase sigma factor [bacterium]
MQDLERLFDRYRKKGDVRALAKVFDATARDLLALANHLVRDHDDAEDLVQSTFVTAIDRAAHYDRSRPLMPWLAGILSRKATNLIRSRARDRAHHVLDADLDADRVATGPGTGLAPGLEHAELARTIDTALERVGEPYRRVLVPYLRGGQRPEEIARSLDLAPGTVRTQIHRGLTRLRRLLPAGVAAEAYAQLPAVHARELETVRAAVLRHGGDHAVRVAASSTVAVQGIALGGLVMSKVVLVVCTGAVLASLGAAWWQNTAPEKAMPEGATVERVVAPTPSDLVPTPTSTSSLAIPAPNEAAVRQVASGTEPRAGRVIVRGTVHGIRPRADGSRVQVSARPRDVRRRSTLDHRARLDELRMARADARAQEQMRVLERQLAMDQHAALRAEIDRNEAALSGALRAEERKRANGAVTDEGTFEIDLTASLRAVAAQGESGTHSYELRVWHALYVTAKAPFELAPQALARIDAGEDVVVELDLTIEPAAVLRGKVQRDLELDRPRVELVQRLAEDLDRAAAGKELTQIADARARFERLRIMEIGHTSIELALLREGDVEPVATTKADTSGEFEFKIREDGPFVLVAVANDRLPLALPVALELAAAVELEAELELPAGDALEGVVEDFGIFPAGGLPLEAERLSFPGDQAIDWGKHELAWSRGDVVRRRAVTVTGEDNTFRFSGLAPGQHELRFAASEVHSVFTRDDVEATAIQVPVPAEDVRFVVSLAALDVEVSYPRIRGASAKLHVEDVASGAVLASVRLRADRRCAVLAAANQRLRLRVELTGYTFSGWEGSAPGVGQRQSVTLTGSRTEGD